MKIIDVLLQDFVDYMGRCDEQTVISKFSGKELLRIAMLESHGKRKDMIQKLIEKSNTSAITIMAKA